MLRVARRRTASACIAMSDEDGIRAVCACDGQRTEALLQSSYQTKRNSKQVLLRPSGRGSAALEVVTRQCVGCVTVAVCTEYPFPRPIPSPAPGPARYCSAEFVQASDQALRPVGSGSRRA